MNELVLERRNQQDTTGRLGRVLIAPVVSRDYWAYRVKLNDKQAIIGFPKFGTIGIGFAVEDDLNTNLPYTTEAEEIYEHIAHNKADDAISDADCIAAIKLIQKAATADRKQV